MKCINCGWNNPDGAPFCEKCHSPLAAPAPQVQQVIAKPAHRSGQPAGTPAPDTAGAPLLCARCGYPMSPRMKECPNCHNKGMAQQVQQIAAKSCPECGTVIDQDDKFCRECGAAVDSRSLAMRTAGMDPAKAKQCTLTPLPSKGLTAKGRPVNYTDSPVVLRRDNTEPSNPTIAVGEQACIVNDQGRWYIENRSDDLTTFMRVNRRIELRDGDIIVMGNRGFEFHT